MAATKMSDIIIAIPYLWDCGRRLINGYKFCRKNIPDWKKKIPVWYRHRKLLRQNRQYQKSLCKHDPLYRYSSALYSHPYYSERFQELPLEAKRLYFRILDTFRKRYLGLPITLYSINIFSEHSIFFPIGGLRKCLSMQDFNKNMAILEHSGFIRGYFIYNQDKLENIGEKLQSYFSYIKKNSSIPAEEGIIMISLSRFGVKCYLLANGYEESIPEEDFCVVEIGNNNEVDLAESFFTQEDI